LLKTLQGEDRVPRALEARHSSRLSGRSETRALPGTARNGVFRQTV